MIQNNYEQVKAMLDNVALKQDKEGYYYTEISMIVFERYRAGIGRYESVKPFVIKKNLFEAVYYRYRPQILSQTKPYTMIPFENYQTTSRGIWNNLETNPISQNKRIQGLNRLAALMFGWVDYSAKVDGYYKTIPFNSAQIFYSFLLTNEKYRMKYLSRYHHIYSTGEDIFIEPFEIFDGNYDFQLELNKELKKYALR